MKDMGELAVDLAYGSVLFDSKEVAEEVLELEAEVDALQSRFEAWTLRAASRIEDSVELRGLVHLARATETISDAALEISEGVLRGLSTHPVVQAAVEESDEVFIRVVVDPGSRLDGVTLGEEEVKTETGMRVIAVRRGTAG
ncbi:MAG: potassium channel family protein, partial [Halanaeroarchaeum sp.]